MGDPMNLWFFKWVVLDVSGAPLLKCSDCVVYPFHYFILPQSAEETL